MSQPWIEELREDEALVDGRSQTEAELDEAEGYWWMQPETSTEEYYDLDGNRESDD